MLIFGVEMQVRCKNIFHVHLNDMDDIHLKNPEMNLIKFYIDACQRVRNELPPNVGRFCVWQVNP